MSTFDRLFKDLKAEVTKIERRFLKKYFPAQPKHTPEVFEYDVKSYCILTHASFEEFLELVSEQILSQVHNEFLEKERFSLATATLLLTYAENWKLGEGKNSITTCFNEVRNALEDCKKKHSITLKDNHGFSLKHMQKVLNPVGINAPMEGWNLDSVSRLASARGSFAHTKSKNAMYGDYKRARTPLSPEDAKKCVLDCLKICKEICDSANKRW